MENMVTHYAKRGWKVIVKQIFEKNKNDEIQMHTNILFLPPNGKKENIDFWTDKGINHGEDSGCEKWERVPLG